MDHLLSKEDSNTSIRRRRRGPLGGHASRARLTSAPSLPPEGSPPAPPRGSRVSQTRPCHSLSTSDRDGHAPDVARPGPAGAGGASGCLFLFLGGVSAGAGCGARQPDGLPRPLASGQVGAEWVRLGGDPGRGRSSALLASLTIRLLVTQASRIESLRGSGKSNQSLSERAARRRPSLSRGGSRRPAVEEWAARRVARRRGPRHRREVCTTSSRSPSLRAALGPRLGVAVGSAWSSPQGHGVDA